MLPSKFYTVVTLTAAAWQTITLIHDFALHTKILETKFFAVLRKIKFNRGDRALYYEGSLLFSLSKSVFCLEIEPILTEILRKTNSNLSRPPSWIFGQYENFTVFAQIAAGFEVKQHAYDVRE